MPLREEVATLLRLPAGPGLVAAVQGMGDGTVPMFDEFLLRRG